MPDPKKWGYSYYFPPFQLLSLYSTLELWVVIQNHQLWKCRKRRHKEITLIEEVFHATYKLNSCESCFH